MVARGGAQFVAGVGDEAPQAILGAVALGERGLDLGEHHVQRGREPADLGVGGGDIDATGVVACGDLSGGPLDLGEGTQPEPDQYHPGRCGDRENEQTDGEADQREPAGCEVQIGQ